MEPANEARGEFALAIDGTPLVVAATMQGLGAMSTALKARSLADLWEGVTGLEPNAMEAAVRCLTIRGDKEAALASLAIRHFALIRAAVIAAFAHSSLDAPGNVEGARANP